MLFPELERYKKQSSYLAEQLPKLEVYLAEVLDRSVPHAQNLDHAAYDIVPILVAQSLKIDEGLALVLLGVGEDAGVIAHRYHVLCPVTESYIGAFDSKEDLPEYIQCPFEVETEHSIDEYFIELIFNFSPNFIRDHKLVASM